MMITFRESVRQLLAIVDSGANRGPIEMLPGCHEITTDETRVMPSGQGHKYAVVWTSEPNWTELGAFESRALAPPSRRRFTGFCFGVFAGQRLAGNAQKFAAPVCVAKTNAVFSMKVSWR